jgi:hypothetical protein
LLQKTTTQPKKRGDVRSDLEWCIWNNLKRTKKPRSIKVHYEAETIDYEIISYRKYTPDLVITRPRRKNIYVEIKGYFRREDMLKMISVKKTHPKMDIRMIFPQDNKVVGRKKMRYSDWCKKYGFKYHIGTAVPKEWLK